MNEPQEDRQKAVFTEASEDDWHTQALGFADTVVHEPGDPDDDPIRTPEEWHGEGWDSERQPPKTVAEAKLALAQRIADDSAPDGPEVAGAYDNLPDGDEG